MSERWTAPKAQQERCIQLEIYLDEEITQDLCGGQFPFPSRDWEVELVPDGEDETTWPLIYVHLPTGQRFEIESQVTARSLADPETEKRQLERESQLAAGQMEMK